MEYVRGETLAEMIKRRAPLSVAQKLKLMAELCAGLAQAHEAGIIHRDIKPANLMVDQQGRLKILDFGIARVAEGNKTRVGLPLTQVNMLIGTPGYMSPEQIEGGEVDHRSDIFAVGAVCYELLAYDEAFAGANTRQIENSVLRGQPAPLASMVPGLDPEIDEIVLRALKRDPNKRYQDAATFERALERLRSRLGPDAAGAAAAADAAAAAEPARQVARSASGGRVPARARGHQRRRARRRAAIRRRSAGRGSVARRRACAARADRTPCAGRRTRAVASAAGHPDDRRNRRSDRPRRRWSRSRRGCRVRRVSPTRHESRIATRVSDPTRVSEPTRVSDPTRASGRAAASAPMSASAPTIVVPPSAATRAMKGPSASPWKRVQALWGQVAQRPQSGQRRALGVGKAQQPLWVRYRTAAHRRRRAAGVVADRRCWSG